MGTQGSLSVHREFTSKQQMLNSKNVEISMFSKNEKLRKSGVFWWMIRGSNAILSDFPNRSKR